MVCLCIHDSWACSLPMNIHTWLGRPLSHYNDDAPLLIKWELHIHDLSAIWASIEVGYGHYKVMRYNEATPYLLEYTQDSMFNMLFILKIDYRLNTIRSAYLLYIKTRICYLDLLLFMYIKSVYANIVSRSKVSSNSMPTQYQLPTYQLSLSYSSHQH